MANKVRIQQTNAFLRAYKKLHNNQKDAVDMAVADVVRDLMRSYIARQNIPNAETVAAIEAVERGEITSHTDTDALYRTLGICFAA